MQKRTHQRSRRRHGRHTAPPSSRKPGPPLRESTLILARQALIDYLKLMAPHFDRAEQRCWSAFYLCGQLSDLERKTIEPMVLNLLGVHAEAIRAVQQFIGQSPWAYQPLIRQLEVLVADWLGESEGVLIVDGSGFPKRGEHSAGVAWQYCGRLGKVDNCQVGVFLVYASAKGQAFLNGQLYVPEQWFTPEYASRWKQCGLPPNLAFRTEPEIALALIQQVVEHNQVPFQWVVADEGFGRNPGFLDGLDGLGKRYLVEVPKDTRVWLKAPGVEPPGPSLTGRPRLHPRVVRSAPPPQTVEDIAAHVPASRWKRRRIKEGSQGPMWAEFVWLRVTPVRDRLPGSRCWLVIRRSLDGDGDSDSEQTLKYYLSNAPAGCSPEELVRLTGCRWPVETAFEEAKSEVGMAHYEIRGWLGWHHHMVQTFMAHLFLVHLQHLLQKKPGDHPQSSSTTHRPCHCRRVWRWPRRLGLHSVLAEAQSSGLCVTSQTHATPIAG